MIATWLATPALTTLSMEKYDAYHRPSALTSSRYSSTKKPGPPTAGATWDTSSEALATSTMPLLPLPRAGLSTAG